MPGPDRRTVLTGLASAAVLWPAPALAHHGWSWTSPEFFSLTGDLVDIYIGNPHATLDLDVSGVVWRVELAPLARTLGAGFDDDVVALGAEITAIGHRSLDPVEARMKAVRVIVGETVYDVYPERAAGIPAA